MKKKNYDDDICDSSNAEYVVLQTTNMNISNKPPTGKSDNLALLLQESDSVTNFRRYLDSINSGHFLDFWFACQGFKNFDKSDSHKLNQLMKVIYRAYIRSESPFAVPLKSNTKKLIVDKLSDRKSFDASIFDIAQSEIRDILATEFLIKFFKSEFYTDTNMFDKCSVNSTSNNIQLSEVPISSSSSTGYISRRFLGGKLLGTSRSSEAVTEGSINKESPLVLTYTAQNTGTITSGFNNSYLGANGGSTSSKDRRNLSEIDPPAFAKILSNKLEEIFVEQTKFDKILRLVKSVPNESDTDDSHSSAISYLMKCQMYSPKGGNCCSVDGDMVSEHIALLSNVSGKMKSIYPCSTDVKDDYAQGILESHCSRIGVDQNESRHTRRDSSDPRSKWKREHDLGSITSYDSGVATSLEQYSNLGIPPYLLDTIFEWHKNSSKNLNPIDVGIDNHRYHHHHHHHHHKNHSDYSLQKGFLAVNNLSDVSSNFDSGISSTYENMGRRFQPTDDKVSNWMSKNPKVTSKTSYNFNDSFLPSLTSGMPPNTPLISTRGISSLPQVDNYSHQSYLLQRCYPNKICSPLPESGILPCQSIENWLEQQDNSSTVNNDFYRSNYCSSTVGVAGSELLIREDFCHKDQRPILSVLQPIHTKDQPQSNQSSKPKVSGPLVVGYYIGNDPVPYRTQIPDAQYITLGQFKSLIAKKGPFRYFFKRYCDEFECGVVHEEITKDDVILPLWEGKVVAKIEKSD